MPIEAVVILIASIFIILALIVIIWRQNKLACNIKNELNHQILLLNELIKHTPIGMALLDPEGRYLIVNRALAKINGIPEEEMIGRKLREVLPPEVARDSEKLLNETLSTRKPVIIRGYTTPVANGRYADIEYHPVISPEGELKGAIALILETTEQVRAHWELRKSYERERVIAETLQKNLLTDIPHIINGVEFETIYNAAIEEARVGGDFYDVFELNKDKTAVVIGDVSGKGLKAAVQIALTKYAIRSQAYTHIHPSVVMKNLNKILVKELDEESFVTLFFGVIDRKSMTFTYVNAGHAPVFFWNNAEKSASIILATGQLLGFLANTNYEEKSIDICPGDELLMGTDGLVDIRCGSEFVDIDRLLRLYKELKINNQPSAAALINYLLGLSKGRLRDDVAILRAHILD